MNRQDAVDDRDLDRWVQEVTDDWRQPALRVGQPSWQHRVVQPSGRSFHGLTTARRAAVGLAGVALVGIVAVAADPRARRPTERCRRRGSDRSGGDRRSDQDSSTLSGWSNGTDYDGTTPD